MARQPQSISVEHGRDHSIPITLGIAIIVVLSLVAYSPVWNAGFIWDDDDYVTNNALLHDVDGLIRLWQPGSTKQYYPAVFTTFWIEYQLWEIQPRGYHIVNVLLHIANALLVWRLCVALRIPPLKSNAGVLAGAWFIAAVFALHPVHVESVAWITERKNVLSGFFYLAAAIAYLRFDSIRFESNDARAHREAWGWYGLSLVLFVLALLSKTVTCSLPAAIILMLLHQRRTLSFSRVAFLLPMFIVGLALALNTASIERTHVGADGPNFAFSFADRLLIASKALLFYPRMMLWPYPLMFIYPRWTIDDQNINTYWSVLFVVVIAIGMVLVYRRSWRGPALAAAFFAGTIVPALGFFNVYPMLFSFAADHFQYLASLGVIVLLIGGVTYWIGRPAIVLCIAGVMLPSLTALTVVQSSIYDDAESVWRDTLDKNPNSWMPHNNLASLLIRKGDAMIKVGSAAQANTVIEEALSHADKALALRPAHYPALSNRSEALRLLNRYDDALISATQMLQQHPEVAGNHWMVGRLLHLLKRNDEAMEEYQATLQRDSKHTEARTELARLLARQGSLEDAATHYEILLKQEPRNIDALVILGDTANKAGRFRDALSYFSRAFEVAGNDPALVTHSGYRLVKLLATCPEKSFRNGPQSVRVGEELRRINPAPSPYLLDVLSSAYAEVGRFDDAIRTATDAAQLARSLGLEPLAADIDQRAVQFRAASSDRK